MQGHTGGIYKADNWTYCGLTKPERAYRRGKRLVSRKRGPKTLTEAEMQAEGCEMVGAFAKHRFIMIRRRGPLLKTMVPESMLFDK
jgi:hypothetical protein